MTLSLYRDEALKTNTSAWESKTHMVSGIITEIGEIVDAHKKHYAYGKHFDKINEQEELGDAWWYVAGLMEDCAFPTEDTNLFELESVIPKEIDFLFLAFTVQEAAREYYETDRNTVRVVALAVIMDLLHSYAVQRGYKTEKIWEANINKLRKRYGGDKFTVEGAINRDCANEREGLESDLKPNG